MRWVIGKLVSLVQPPSELRDLLLTVIVGAERAEPSTGRKAPVFAKVPEIYLLGCPYDKLGTG